MRPLAIALAIVICGQSFCPQLQQTSAATLKNSNLALTDVNDSEVFFRSASRLPKPARDNKRRVEQLLARMTLEEKVGQMTQLQIATVTSGEDQNIKIDPAKLEKAVD